MTVLFLLPKSRRRGHNSCFPYLIVWPINCLFVPGHLNVLQASSPVTAPFAAFNASARSYGGWFQSTVKSGSEENKRERQERGAM